MMKILLLSVLIIQSSVHSIRSDIVSQSGAKGSDALLFCSNNGSVLWEKCTDRGRSVILRAEKGEITNKYKPDPENRFSVLTDLSLFIKSLSVSDSGIYCCNGAAVLNLTVIPSIPSTGNNHSTPSPDGSCCSSAKSRGNHKDKPGRSNPTAAAPTTPSTISPTTSISANTSANSSTAHSMIPTTKPTPVKSSRAPSTTSPTKLTSAKNSTEKPRDKDKAGRSKPPAAAPIKIFSQSRAEGSDALLICNNDGRVIWEKCTDRGSSVILLADNGKITEKYKPDPENRYSVLKNDSSLFIKNLSVSDSGIYCCNSDPVVNLTVIPTSAPSLSTPASPLSTSAPPHSTSPTTEGIIIAVVVVGAGLVLLAVVLMRRCSKQKAQDNEHVYATIPDSTSPATQPDSAPPRVYEVVYSLAGDPDIVKLGLKNQAKNTTDLVYSTVQPAVLNEASPDHIYTVLENQTADSPQIPQTPPTVNTSDLVYSMVQPVQ